jgi:predicted nucleotidyltransferase
MIVSLDFDSKTLEKLCRKHGVRMLVLHGSYVSGRANEKSDIDVGMMMSRKIGAKAYLNILSDFGELFGDKFDPVILNGAEPLISYQVALHGKLLYEKEKGLFASFRTQAVARYHDSKKFRDLEKLYLKRAIAQG